MANETDIFKGFVIRQAEVFDDNRFIFVVDREVSDGWQAGDPPPDAFIVKHDGTTGAWDWQPAVSQTGAYTSATGTGSDGAPESVFVSTDRKVSSIRFADQHADHNHELGYDHIVRVGALRFIGDHAYLCGGEQTVLRRTGAREWERLHFKKGGPRPRDNQKWEAIDGYSDTDIYTTGSQTADGAVFHFNGTNWTAMTLPKGLGKFRGRALCCAPDGIVYVVSLAGALICGNATEGWTSVVDPDDVTITEVTNSEGIAWFKDRLYVSNQSWLYTPVDGQWQPVKAEKGFQPLSFGGLSTNGSVMLVYGEFGAVVYDGDVWSRLYAPYSIDDLVRAEGLKAQLEAVQDGVAIMKDIDARQGR